MFVVLVDWLMDQEAGVVRVWGLSDWLEVWCGLADATFLVRIFRSSIK
jgi:hypothetical protein